MMQFFAVNNKLSIISDSFNRSNIGDDYSVTGGTFTVDGKLNLSGGTNVFTNYISKNFTTALEIWTSEIKFKLSSIASNTYGLGVTIKSTVFDFTIKLCCNTSELGKIKIYGYGGNLHTTSSNSANLNSTDNFLFKIVRNKTIFTSTVKNLNTGETFTHSWESSVSVVNSLNSLPKTGKPSINNFGGNISIYRWNFYTYYKNIKLAILGDSITQTYYASTILNRYAEKINVNNKSILGSGGDTTTLLLTRLDDIFLIKPKNILIFIGANDSSTTTFNTNYRQIIDSLAGYNIILTSCIPRNSTDRRPYNTIIQQIATDYNLQFIDIFTPLVSGSISLASQYDSGDGTHPNDLGHEKIAEVINNNININ